MPSRAVTLGALLLIAGCARSDLTPHVFTVSGDYNRLSSCVYREAKDHSRLEPVHIEHLEDPSEVRVSQTTANGGEYLIWEAAFLPVDPQTTRIEVRSPGRYSGLYNEYLADPFQSCKIREAQG